MLFLRFLRFFEGQDILKFDADCGERALGLMNSCGIVYRCPGREEDGSVRVEISHSDRQKVVSLLDKNGIRVYTVSYTHLGWLCLFVLPLPPSAHCFPLSVLRE